MNASYLGPLQKASGWRINRPEDIVSKRQTSVTLARGTTLAEVETRNQERAAGATTQDPAMIKGKLLQFGLWLQKQGYAEQTIKNWIVWLKGFVKLGADLWNPESVKEILGKQAKWSSSYKMLLMYAYESFLKMENMTWARPRYAQAESLCFIPTEEELNQLISAASKVISTFLLGLKETGADPGELAKLTWTSINKESKTVNIPSVKGHNPRILRVSQQFIDRLEQLPKSERVFPNISGLESRFFRQRKHITRKLNNPRLMKISFRTFRHWKGTMEYHRTKDILYVKKILGHKLIQNTLKYIDLETSLFEATDDQFTVKVAANTQEACKLAEVGFEYVTGEYNDGGKIFRKRK
jgi:integrase